MHVTAVMATAEGAPTSSRHGLALIADIAGPDSTSVGEHSRLCTLRVQQMHLGLGLEVGVSQRPNLDEMHTQRPEHLVHDGW